MSAGDEHLTLAELADVQRELGSKAALDLLNAAALQAEVARIRRDVLNATCQLVARHGLPVVVSILQVAEHDPEVCDSCWALAERCATFHERRGAGCCTDCTHSPSTVVDDEQ